MHNLNTKTPSMGGYRADIDGLRAVAVLLVVGFHAFPSLFKAGFIGVDIFFVISGYLISKIIIQDLHNNKFSFEGFYARRARRIFPALILVLIASLLVGLVVLQSDELIRLLKHIASGGAFLINYVLISEGGYFDRLAESKPLLNLWSLSIEEQFYIVWPLILFCVFYFRWQAWIFILVLGSASLVFALINARTSPVEAFYSLSSRAWELLLGAGLAWVQLFAARLLPRDSVIKAFTSMLGLIMLVVPLIVIDPVAIHPDGWLLLAPIGAALLIASQSDGYINRYVLSHPLLVSIGLISYPLYLWHWPIFSFARITYGGRLTTLIMFLLIGLSFFLAAITYHFVEKPVRNKWNTNRVAVLLSALLLMISATSFYYALQPIKTYTPTQSAKNEFYAYFANTPHTRWLHFFETEFRHECNFYQVDEYHAGRPTNTPKPSLDLACYQADLSKTHRVFLWGDSHAQMLYSGLARALPNSWQILQVASSGCAARIDNIQLDKTDYCSQSNRFALQVIKDTKPDTVVVSQSANHNIDSMNRLSATLEQMGVSRIIFVGPSPKWEDDLPKILIRRLWPSLPERTWVGVKRETIELNARLKNNFLSRDGRSFVDVIGLFCNHNGCLTRIGSDSQTGATSWDYGHLTDTASEYLARELLAPEILRTTPP